MFDRTWEWEQLIQFARDDTPGATLGLVYGRRRQGKSFLLDALAESTTGLYLEATRDVEARTLIRLGAQIGQFLGSPAPLTLPNWEAAIDALLALGRRGPLTVVLDEFPYLLAASPAVASVIQSAYGPRRPQRLESQTRLILCGSALSVMRNLMTGQAPLRGRASLELQVDTFDYRTAREFWNITDLRTAAQVHASLRRYPRLPRPHPLRHPRRAGGLRRLGGPCGPQPSLATASRGPLPVQRGPRRPGTPDLSLHSGHRRRRGDHPGQNRLRDRSEDHRHWPSPPGSGGHGVPHQERGRIRPAQTHLAYRGPDHGISLCGDPTGLAATAAPGSRRRGLGTTPGDVRLPGSRTAFRALVPPWAREFADPATFRAESIAEVGQGVLHAGRNASYEIDVAVFGPGGKHRRLLSIGEAKWGEVMGMAHLACLREAMTWLADRTTLDMSTTIPACYSAAGFTSELHAAAAAGEVVLVDLNRLYHGA